MTDFLTALRSKQGVERADALLTAVGSKNLKATRERAGTPLDVAGRSPASNHLNGSNESPEESQDGENLSSPGRAGIPAEALQILRSQPGLKTLLVVLEQLNSRDFDEDFSLAVPGPMQAQLISTLLGDIVPTFWHALTTENRDLLLSTLRNVAGLNAIVARLRLLASQQASGEGINDLLDIASRLFTSNDLVASISTNICQSIADHRKRDMMWKELLNLFGSGKVIGAVAQAEDALRKTSKSPSTRSSWLANGNEYCTLLGRNILQMIKSVPREDEKLWMKHAALLLAKGLHLGHSGQLLKGLLRPGSSTKGSSDGGQIGLMVQSLAANAKRTLTEHLLHWLSTAVAPKIVGRKASQEQGVSAICGLLLTVLKSDIILLQAQLSDPVLCSSLSLQVRRACLAVMDGDAEDDTLQQLLETLISTFSSTLFIAHAPIAQQESLAQSILIAAGYVHRKAPMSLLMTARSSGHMQGVSHRLDSSNIRARWLGMVVGTSLSKLVDKPGSQMEFEIDDMKTGEAEWYAALPDVKDTVGTFENFQALLESQEQLETTVKAPLTKPSNSKMTEINGKPVFGPPRPPRPAQTKIVGERVTEILDDGSDDEDDLKPYAKPDSDPEDSDEDATLANRNKTKAPVYIRDLMAGLRDDQNFDRFNLSIKTAAQLIRRKAGYGKEVKDHAEELVGMLCNLQDPFDTDDFDDMRLQALVALVLSDVKIIAPLLSRQAFAEGYSIAQRCVILSALGLGGRELAGLKIEDEDYNPKQNNVDFPSKKLPPRLHAMYSSSASQTTRTNRLEAATQSLEHQMIQPLALQAADQSTAHLNAVKVRTFSSRMDVEKARTKRKPPANELAKCFGESFFFPLANRYQQEVAAYGSSSIYASSPFVLVTFIKTLALLFHASGPATLGLPQISAEMWDLLLSLRVQAIGDISVLQAVLFALLTLLEINTDKQRIAQEHPKQLMETQQWVDLVFERTGSGGLVDGEGKSEEAKVRTLAAGVLMKCSEIIEAYQKQLVGYDFR